MILSYRSSLVSSGTVVIALAAAACSSDLPSGQSTGRPEAEFQAAGNAAQDAMLSKIGRGLALALSDPAMRRWVRSRIDASPYVEWRVPFRDVLVQEAGLPQIRRVIGLTRLTSAETAKQRNLPDLELYFPIPAHRTGWRADAPVQVAVRIGHSDDYTVYAMDGSASSSRGDRMPSIATLVLAASEIDYADRPSAVRGGSRTGPGMQAAQQALQFGIGNQALPPPDEPPPPPPPTGGATTSRHTRLGYFRTTRFHDDIFGGRDEVEIFGSVAGVGASCTWRADVGPNTDYFLDLSNPFYTIAKAIPWGTATVFIRAMEDDDDRCVLRSSDDNYGSTFLKIDQYGTVVGTSNPGHIALRVHSVVP